MKIFVWALLCVSSLASANKISTTYERMTIRSFDGSAYTCKDAQLRAMLGCNAWLSEFSETHNITDSAVCRALECGCSVTEHGSKAACLGTATYLTTIQASEAEVDGKLVMTGEKRGCPLKTDPIVRTVGTGLDCWEAELHAKYDMFRKLSNLSDNVDILDLRPIVCNCRYGDPTYAACTTTAHALWQKSVPWDAPPCE